MIEKRGENTFAISLSKGAGMTCTQGSLNKKNRYTKKGFISNCVKTAVAIFGSVTGCAVKSKTRQFVLPIFQPLIPKMAYYAKYHRRFRGGLIRKLHDDDQEEEEGENHQV